ncbi:MAG: TraR/DksA C4-type zinc finger protein [Senegalia sp. (in: firmicutes)]
MNKEKTEKYKEMLLKEKENIKETISDLKEEFDGSVTNSTGELSSYDNHPADIGTEVFMQEHNMNLTDNQKNIMTKIDIALKNMQEGEYGSCIVCGREIEEERLDILPYTVTCIEHKEKIDEVIGMTDTSEAKYLSNILRRMNKGDENYSGIDGDDINRKLQEHNKIEDDPSNSTGDSNGVFEDDKGSVEDIEDIPDNQKK